MSNLAVVSSGYGYLDKDDLLNKTAGRFVGAPPPFKKTIVVSYSAFDTFTIPGKNEIEKKKLAEKGEVSDYVYCGLRELVKDSQKDYRLKSQDDIKREFLFSLQKIRDIGRFDSYIHIIQPLFQEPSFQRIGLFDLYAESDNSTITETFTSLSSGHKSVIKIVTDITAHIAGKEPSLILIDEPETHLHPPLLAAFLKSVRRCLDLFNGYAVIATHSPVVLQETPSRYVRVMRRVVDNNSIDNVDIETFGEGIGMLTQKVFNLGDGTTDWHETLEKLSKNLSLKDLEEKLQKPLGFSARSYFLSLTREQKTNHE